MESILVRSLWIASVAGQAAVLFRIWSAADLRFPYAFFGSFLAANLSRSLVLIFIDYRSPVYTVIWTASEPLLLILQILAVAEVYDRICAAYPGVARHKYRLLAVTAVVAAAASAFTLVIGIPRMMMWNYFVVMGVKCFVATSSVVFLLLVWGVFRHFPVRRGRNLQTHWRLLTIYLGWNAAGLLAMTARPATAWINMLVLAGVTLCYGFWTVTLSASGESARQPSSEAEKQQWTRTQERASAVLCRITVRELLGLVLAVGH